MSVRERRNRKDAKGKTPEQIQRGLARHERAYADAIAGQTEADFPLSSAAYMRGIRATFASPVERET